MKENVSGFFLNTVYKSGQHKILHRTSCRKGNFMGGLVCWK